jgi:hypothetical protein
MSQPGPTDLLTAGQQRFWRLAQPLLIRPGVTSSTMMGLPCLRHNGHFFAACDRRTGNLLAKLSEARVTELLEAGHAGPFAPAGRRFRQWAAIPESAARIWEATLDEALAFAEGHPRTRP